MEYTEDDLETQIADDNNEDGEDWMYTHSNRATKTMEEIAQTIMTEEEEEAEVRKGLEKLDLDKILDLDDIPNMDEIPDMDDQVQEEDDPAVEHNTKYYKYVRTMCLLPMISITKHLVCGYLVMMKKDALLLPLKYLKMSLKIMLKRQ
ncbi:hypothetical protein G6F68_016316 [Rhizopus microsporus]|nr:hypothetical protein G6F68_016316 [Rhizopus microsporus]